MGSSRDKGWDTKPKLDEAKAIAPDTPAHQSRKNRRKWCRGKVGVEHVTAIRVDKRYESRAQWWTLNRGGRLVGCEYYRWSREPLWRCIHEVVCTNCGKIMRVHLGRDCPDWHPRPAKAQVRIDLNVRVRGNWTVVGQEDVDRPVRVGDVGDFVEVFEPESGVSGPGRIEAIDWRKRLVYLSVDWKALQ